MKASLNQIAVLVLVTAVAASLLGGSLVWSLLGLSDDLTIAGQAVVVHRAPAKLGNGWPAYGGDSGGNRYSSASLITPGNVQQLEIAWTHRTGTLDGRDHLRKRTAFEATPILVDDSLIFCSPFNEVVALDPATGTEKWRFDAEIPTDGEPANNFVCRGVSHWQTTSVDKKPTCASRIFMGTVDSRLIALDSGTGELCTDFGSGGAVQIEPSISLRWPGEFQITSAPAVIGDKIITGSAISDNLRSEAPLGTVHAFDARTGELSWYFNPVPRDLADPARASWAGNSADRVGHANVWSTIAVDEERGLVYLPTSSASPDFYGGARTGDNHYANSVVALDAESGEVVWHFQTVHHDVWDYDVPSQPGLYQVWRDGQLHDVVAQVTKTGLVFVLDRDSGKPFLPIEERPAPQNGVPGEALSATQPYPVDIPPIVPNEIYSNDAFGITFWDKWACARRLESLRHEGLFTPPSIQGTVQYPFSGGGANWGGSAYDPSRNLLVVNMSNAAHQIQLYPKMEDRAEIDRLKHDAEFAPMEGVPYAVTRELILSPLGLPCNPPPWGVLAGVDLASGKIVWRRILGTTEEIAPAGIGLKLGTPNFGGPIVTASGLIFIGAAMDDYLRAFSIETGDELWKGRLPAGGQATPMTYQWNDRQYVVIAAGGHAESGTNLGDYIVAFGLPN